MEQQETRSQHVQAGQPRLIRLRTVVIFSSVLVFLTSIATAGALSLAFLLGGKNRNLTSVERQRQTVVQEGEAIADIAQEVGQSVVSIVTRQASSGLFGSGSGAGTGVILDSGGLIITNRHVVPDGTDNVQIITYDGTSYDSVEIVGRDPLNDLAILKVRNPNNFTPARLANSDEVRTGQKVIAIGNALGQFQNTVTMGIISGIGRPVVAGDASGTNT